ncbi:hypothetical protein NAL32_22085 [Chryseobacterium sp. Ch-15]|nr:hypothetical protein [Chryseobacterium muglaense]MCC9036525.1 hypothetical protein [Chryseobacterium muglaense]MCM2557076.1 hypothetical protein [Chryseobacterium muglaense]
MFAIENFSKEIFWANENEENIYQNISNFNCFETKIISKEQLKKTILNAPFNLDGWMSYYQNLLDVKFSEFSEKKVIGKKVIKYRSFKKDFFIGIQTDYQMFKNNFKKDFNEDPNHKLIIFKNVEKKKIEEILTFDNFFHPHFAPPIYSFGSYFYAKNTIQISDVELSLKYIVEKEFLDNGNIKLYMSEEFGEHLKRHAYFYYDMLYHTTNEFIKFVEESFNSEMEDL